MPIVYRTPDDEKWGSGKGSNLSASEVDNNFWQLAQRILAVETDPPSPAEISNIAVIGSQMMIYLGDGRSFGPFTLPYLLFRSRGDWADDINYMFMDIVTVHGRGMYFVNINHTSVAPFDPDRTIEGEKVYTLMFGENSTAYCISFFYPMKPGQGITDGSYMAAHLFALEVTMPAGLPGSLAKLRVAPAADLVLNIRNQAGDLLGTITFAAASTDGVISFASSFAAVPGNYICIEPPASLDSDARDLMVTLACSRIISS